MWNGNVRTNRLLWAGAVAALLASLPCTAQAAEVKIGNYSNETIYVAMAFRKWKGNLAAEGWYAIKSNEEKTLTAPDASDLHIRVQQRGREVIWAKYKTFRYWPVNGSRFSVAKAPDDSSIRVLRWGGSLENDRNINKGDALPGGWRPQRFFRIGSGHHHLHIKP